MAHFHQILQPQGPILIAHVTPHISYLTEISCLEAQPMTASSCILPEQWRANPRVRETIKVVSLPTLFNSAYMHILFTKLPVQIATVLGLCTLTHICMLKRHKDKNHQFMPINRFVSMYSNCCNLVYIVLLTLHYPYARMRLQK